MDKYSGCNVVDSAVYAQKKAPPKKSAAITGFLIRLIAAASQIGMECASKYMPDGVAPSVPKVRELASQVFRYDGFGRADIGSFPLISQCIETIA